MNDLFLAFVETRSWTFEAAGRTETEALRVLRRTFTAHMKALGGTLRWSEIKGDAWTRQITIGGAWIDGQLVSS